MNTDFSSRTLIEYLREGELARLSTISSDGKPHVVPVWYVYRDAPVGEIKTPRIYILTDKKSVKAKNISQNPNVALVIDEYNEKWDVSGMVVRGKAKLLDDKSEPEFKESEFIHELMGTKYPEYWEEPWAREERVVIRIDPEEYSTWNVLGVKDAYELDGVKKQLGALVERGQWRTYGPTIMALRDTKDGLTIEDVSKTTGNGMELEERYISDLLEAKLISKKRNENRFWLNKTNKEILSFAFGVQFTGKLQEQWKI